jgi:ATP-dependent protease ClpP protease subunit
MEVNTINRKYIEHKVYMINLKFFLVFALLGTILHTALANDLLDEEENKVQSKVYFSGSINASSVQNFIKKVEKTLLKNTGTRKELIITLDSPGGEIFHAIEAVKYIRKVNSDPQIEVHTKVTSYGSCESACTILYTAGEKRFASFGSRFGFHSPNYKSGNIQGKTPEEVEEIYRNIWLNYIYRVDATTSEMLKVNRYLFGDHMRYIDGRDLTTGYVTDLI